MQRQVPADRWRGCRRCSLVVDVAVSIQRQVPAALGAQTSSSTKSWIASDGDFLAFLRHFRTPSIGRRVRVFRVMVFFIGSPRALTAVSARALGGARVAGSCTPR